MLCTIYNSGTILNTGNFKDFTTVVVDDTGLMLVGCGKRETHLVNMPCVVTSPLIGQHIAASPPRIGQLSSFRPSVPVAHILP